MRAALFAARRGKDGDMGKNDIEARLEAHYRQVRRREVPDAAAKARAIARAGAEARILEAAADGAADPAAAARGAGRAAADIGAIGPAGAKPAATAAAAGTVAAGSACRTEEAFGGIPFARFVLGQVRYIRPWVWAAQAVLLATLLVGSALAPTDAASSALTSIVALLTVLVGMPDVLRSREDGVAELEYACRFDCRQVLAARLIVLGLSDVVVLTAAVLAVPALAGSDPMLVFLHACAPYFATAAGCLWIAGRAQEGATARCLAFGSVVAVAAMAAWQIVPDAYAASSAGVWAALFAFSLGAAVYETRACFDVVRSGLDHLSPAA